MSWVKRIFISITLLITINSTASSADNKTSSVLHQCWPAQQIKATRHEKTPRRGIRRAFVSPPPKTQHINTPIPKSLHGSIRRVNLPKGKKLIALTLDLCESPWEVAGYDGAIFDYLRKHNVKATLFSGGKWLLTHKERAAQLLADPLFEIANHGWTHHNLRLGSKQKMHTEIMHAQAAYEVARKDLTSRACFIKHTNAPSIPKQMKLFRFPYGTCKPQALNMVAQAGLLSIQWDVSTGDPSPRQSARAIANQVLRNTKPGSIIIAHANGRGWNTAKALPLFIPQLKAKGYEFVTVSELLKAGTPVISQSCYDHRPGDTNRYGTVRKKKPSKKQLKYKKQAKLKQDLKNVFENSN